MSSSTPFYFIYTHEDRDYSFSAKCSYEKAKNEISTHEVFEVLHLLIKYPDEEKYYVVDTEGRWNGAFIYFSRKYPNISELAIFPAARKPDEKVRLPSKALIALCD